MEGMRATGAPSFRTFAKGWDIALRATALIFALAFLVVIPEGNLLLVCSKGHGFSHANKRGYSTAPLGAEVRLTIEAGTHHQTHLRG
jgi:hypothetical protein